MLSPPRCLLRREYDPATLLTDHPPRLRHPHKRLAFEVACGPDAVHSGPVTVSRWAAASLPSTVELAPTDVAPVHGFFDYAGPDAGVWHVNFADPHLFMAYGSSLLAQDELQAVEHPVLGSIREALLAERQPALTEQDGEPTPVLVAGVERRCVLDTAPDRDAGRPHGLYGNRFAAATADVVRAAVRPLDPPTRTNLIAIAAPQGGHGRYRPEEIRSALLAACTGFAAAIEESRRMWPGSPVEVHTGFWGCGAFGGNRRLMTLLQILAARLAGVDRLRFHASDESGRRDFAAGAADLVAVTDGGADGTLPDLLERIDDLAYEWGVSDGN